jgi:hypothetical protein
VHCECGTNGLVGILASGTNFIRNVTARNMTLVHTNQGAGLKISEA